MTRFSAASIWALACIVTAVTAFAPPNAAFSRQAVRLFEEKKEATEAVFAPPPEESSIEADSPADPPLETVESLGRGAAKVRHSLLLL